MSDQEVFVFEHLPPPDKQASIYGLVEVVEDVSEQQSGDETCDNSTPESPPV